MRQSFGNHFNTNFATSTLLPKLFNLAPNVRRLDIPHLLVSHKRQRRHNHSTMADSATSQLDHLDLQDKVEAKSNRRGGRGAGQGRGGARGSQGREVQVSKALSKLLRHQAENAGIKLDGEGYASLNEVLAWGPIRSLKVTLDEVKSVVATNEKQRFALKEKNSSAEDTEAMVSTNTADYLIRANQGHSIKVDAAALMEPITLELGNIPPKVIHGTYFIFWKDIISGGGLKPMTRNHVHCSSGTPEEGAISGMRADAELMIEIDVEKSLQAGDKWWLSANGVVLTEGGEGGVLSSRFFKGVTGRKIDVGTLWQDGEKVADLPEGTQMRMPSGKTRGGGRGGNGQRRK